MSQAKYNPKKQQRQLTFPGLAWMTPGYPIRGLTRCCVLCQLHGWRNLGRLAAWQLDRALEGRP